MAGHLHREDLIIHARRSAANERGDFPVAESGDRVTVGQMVEGAGLQRFEALPGVIQRLQPVLGGEQQLVAGREGGVGAGAQDADQQARDDDLHQRKPARPPPPPHVISAR